MKDVVCALIQDAHGRLLACKRAAGGHLGGYWEFPGGKVEPGEGDEEALQREIREELDIEIKVGKSLQPVEWDYGTVSIRLLPYRCDVISGEAHPNEHDEIRWCSAEELAALEWAPADLPILAEWSGGLRPG